LDYTIYSQGAKEANFLYTCSLSAALHVERISGSDHCGRLIGQWCRRHPITM